MPNCGQFEEVATNEELIREWAQTKVYDRFELFNDEKKGAKKKRRNMKRE
jgi:hypothetical protein